MSSILVINAAGRETRVALIENGQIAEFYLERKKDKGIVGNIYKGRVTRVLPGMQSAFVEIGLERAAFLHIADIWEHRQNGHGHDSKPIERILHEGQALLVQVIKDPIGTKGARLSTQVSLAGRLLLYDARATRFNEIRIAWDPANPLSGKSPTIRDLSIHAGGQQGAVCAA